MLPNHFVPFYTEIHVLWLPDYIIAGWCYFALWEKAWDSYSPAQENTRATARWKIWSLSIWRQFRIVPDRMIYRRPYWLQCLETPHIDYGIVPVFSAISQHSTGNSCPKLWWIEYATPSQFRNSLSVGSAFAWWNLPIFSMAWAPYIVSSAFNYLMKGVFQFASVILDQYDAAINIC